MNPIGPSHPPVATGAPARAVLRQRLLAERMQFVAGTHFAEARAALASHLTRILREIEPALLGIYWAVRGEFNAIDALESADLPKLPLALPFAQRDPRQMHYRRWNRGSPPAGRDDCGLPSPDGGKPVVPDVVLVPCVGYTQSGFRLGYGGGFFDRWLAAHRHVTAVGVAWSVGCIDDDVLAPEAHDQPLTFILTERGVGRPDVPRPPVRPRPGPQ